MNGISASLHLYQLQFENNVLVSNSFGTLLNLRSNPPRTSRNEFHLVGLLCLVLFDCKTEQYLFVFPLPLPNLNGDLSNTVNIASLG